MNDITVKKTELIEKVQENRDEHRAIFEEALEGYRAKALELLEGHIARLKSGKLEKVFVSIPMPEDHTRDYDRVLAMLAMEVELEITLTERDFATYVLDDWGWQRDFLATSSNYSGLAITKEGNL